MATELRLENLEPLLVAAEEYAKAVQSLDPSTRGKPFAARRRQSMAGLHGFATGATPWLLKRGG